MPDPKKPAVATPMAAAVNWAGLASFLRVRVEEVSAVRLGNAPRSQKRGDSSAPPSR